MSITYRYSPAEGTTKEEKPTRGGKTFTITRETPAAPEPATAQEYPTIAEATRYIYNRIDKDPEFYSVICELANNQFCELKSIMPADTPIEDIALSMFVQGIIAGNSQVIIRAEEG